MQAHRDSVWAEVNQLLDDVADEPDGRRPARHGPHDGPAEPDRGSLDAADLCLAICDVRVGRTARRNEAGGPSGRPPLLALFAGGPAAAGSRRSCARRQAVTSRTRSSKALT